MDQSASGKFTKKAQVSVPAAQVQLVQYDFGKPPDGVLRAVGSFRLELCLTSRHRSARACFQKYWSPHRFERVGDLFLVPPEMELRTRSDESGLQTSIICELERDRVLALYDSRPPLTDQRLVASLDIRGARVRGLLLRLAEETRHPGFASETVVELTAGLLAIELHRLGERLGERSAPGGLASWRLRLIDERLCEVSDAPTLSELAALCGISVRQLTRGFQASRACSIGAYVANSQMEHARRLLTAGQSVTTIARTLGFSSASNFCYAFRRAMGLTPGQFRQTLLH